MPTEKQNTKNEIRKGIAAIRRHMKPLKKQLTILVVLGLVSAVANGAVPYITGRFFDALINISLHKTASFGSLPLWAFLLALWALTQLIANNADWIADRLRRWADVKTHMSIQTEGFIHLFQLPLSYHKNSHISGEMNKISMAGRRVSEIIRTIVNIAPQFLAILIGITLAASINLQMAGVLLVGVILYVLLLIKILIPVAKIDSAAHRTWNDAWNNSGEAVLQIESVKQAAAEEYESEKTRSAFLNKAYSLWYGLETIWSNVGFFQRAIVLATQLTIFIMSVHLIANGVITIGGLIALNAYAGMFFGPFVQLGYSWQIIQNGIISAAHLEEVFEEPKEKYIPEEAIELNRIEGRVAFEKVSFRYGPDQPWVLTDITFEAKPGQIIALVGESGVGKSTAISLISGYGFPDEGRVLIDDADTRKLNLTVLRKQIAVVPQEVALFNDTLKANIRYGSFGASDNEVIAAAKQARIDEFVNTLPEKYETIVGERGIKLSVGQKQRVAIARAILRDPAILILDEPTSALDAKTEKTVTESLGKLMRGRTTFIIAHRLSTIRKADLILVFDKGKIVERGSHEELINKKRGVYRHLYEYQIGLH